MNFNRFQHIVLLSLCRNGTDRAAYIRKRGIFYHIGKNVVWVPRRVPLYPELISLHDNVFIASNVSFVTHDIAHQMLNKNPNSKQRFLERVGCVEIMDNVFIGAGTRILYNVRIGSNVIVATGSVVTHDLEPNAVYAGVPAKRVKSIEEYMEKLSATPQYPPEFAPRNESVSSELVEYLWTAFKNERNEESLSE